MAADDVGLIGKLRGKRTRDVELPNKSGRQDPRLRTKVDDLREGLGIVRGVIKRAKAGRATRR